MTTQAAHLDSGSPLILIVDDTPDNIDILVESLKESYQLKAALNGFKALEIAVGQPRPDMILLDVMMPDMDGYEVCRRLKKNPQTADIPVIFVTARHEPADEKLGLELGAVDYIVKPISPAIVQARVRTHLTLSDRRRELELAVRSRTRELSDSRLQVIQRLGRAAEFKDNETGLHVIRMSHYSRLIGEAYGGNEQWIDMLFTAAPMHDVGKIGIPDHILLKPGKLDADEWEIMKRHTEFGAEIIGDDPNPLFQMSRTIALTHHEKWDGSGYPRGLAGEDIPLEGRITAISDVFDALISARPYKQGWSDADAVQYINDNSGSHFDPKLVTLFNEALPDILAIKSRYMDKGKMTTPDSSRGAD
jgi:putative two-component system response regulator